MVADGGHGNVGGLSGHQPGEEAAARRRRQPLPPAPLFKLGDGASMEESFHLTAAALEEENSWCLGGGKSRPYGLGLGRILCLD